MQLVKAIVCSCAAFGMAKRAFLTIDTQECFLEQGSLPVVASQIIPNLNAIREETQDYFDNTFVYTQDYHPTGHISFGTAHGMEQEAPNEQMSNSWRGAMTMKCANPDTGDAACCPKVLIDPDSVECTSAPYSLEYCPSDMSVYNADTNPMVKDNKACTLCKDSPDRCFEMVMDLWLDHCLENGDSQFAKGLMMSAEDIIIQKGFRHTEMFSGFFDNTRTYSSDLHATLQAKGIDEIVVAGIATTHCVRWTLQDAIHLGYKKVSVVMDASAGIWGTPTSYANESAAIADFKAQGIHPITTEELITMAHEEMGHESPTCGMVRDAYKAHGCCGNPSKVLPEDMDRRLSQASEKKDLVAQVKQAVREAKTGPAKADLLQKLNAALEPYL